jgi:hypothetical protein
MDAEVLVSCSREKITDWEKHLSALNTLLEITPLMKLDSKEFSLHQESALLGEF